MDKIYIYAQRYVSLCFSQSIYQFLVNGIWRWSIIMNGKKCIMERLRNTQASQKKVSLVPRFGSTWKNNHFPSFPCNIFRHLCECHNEKHNHAIFVEVTSQVTVLPKQKQFFSSCFELGNRLAEFTHSSYYHNYMEDK